MSVKRGDPLVIKASDWNTLLGVADAARLNQSIQRQPGSLFLGGTGVVVPFKNSTGSTVDRYHAVGIGSPLFTYATNAQTFLNQLGFTGAAMGSSYVGRFAVAQETIAAGKIGMAMISGVTAAQITVNNANDTHVDVDTAGGSKLVSQTYGAGEILYKESGTGTKWSVIRIGSYVPVASPKQLIRFSLDEALAKTDASADASIEYQVGSGSSHTATTITVKNPADDTNGDYTYAGAIGATGWAIWDTEAEFWIIDVDCPAA